MPSRALGTTPKGGSVFSKKLEIWREQDVTKEKQTDQNTERSPSFLKDEIDLRELFKVFWKDRSIVVVCSLIFAIASSIYAFNAQQWWSTTALVTKPKVVDLLNFSQAVKRYQPAFDVYQPNGVVLVGKELNKLSEQDKIFERFIEAFNASDNKREYLEQSDVFEEILKSLEVSESDTRSYRVILNEWFKRFNASADKTNPDFTKLSAQSITDQSSFDLLNGYIAFTNQKVTAGLMEDLRSILQVKRHELSQQLESRKQLAAQKLKLEIAKAEKALKIASAAQIMKPVENLNQEEMFPINMGADAIQEKVNVLKDLDDISILEPELEQFKNQIEVLQLELPKIENLKAFSFLKTAELPFSRDEPKRSFIVIVGTLLGLLLGGVIVLFRFAFVHEK